jgi:hypothetical protein
MSGPGEIQRAELFANVDELMAWKKAFELKQPELIEWQLHIENEIKTTIQGCLTLVETDSALMVRMDELSKRIDIVNKRLRHIEEAVERLTPR